MIVTALCRLKDGERSSRGSHRVLRLYGKPLSSVHFCALRYTSPASQSQPHIRSQLLPAMQIIRELESSSRRGVQSRQEVNELDNLTTGKAVDALLNYETVKLFNNERLEVSGLAVQPGPSLLLGSARTP